MDFSREKLKQIRYLMFLATVLVLGIIYFKEILSVLSMLIGILKPFMYGGIIAFILNLPMSAIENKLFQSTKVKYAQKLKRPVSLLLSVLLILLLILITVWMVIPQLASSASEIGRKIPVFLERIQTEAEQFAEKSPLLEEQIGELDIGDIQWDSVMENVTHFMKNGAGNLLSSTFSMVSSIISSVVNGIIAFVFAVYILAQKEKLCGQVQRVMQAYLPGKIVEWVQKVSSLLYTNFSNFITGQCLEAIILGGLFVICMSILRLPFALVIGILIALTALIPIAGAFIGCAVGVFLILIEDPVQALVFLGLFFVLQQVEGKLIYPKVVGNFVGLPGIWVLFAITVGGSLFGIVGMLVFIPLTATVYTLLREDVGKRIAQKKSERRENANGKDNIGQYM
jgi:predicted PurR-regulated permease PerM